MQDHRNALAVVERSPLATKPATADDLAAAFLAGYRPTTRRAYAADLRDWGTFLTRHDIEPLEARRMTVDAYVRQLESDDRSPATIARRLNALSGFYAYALDEDLVARNPVAGVRRPVREDVSQQLGLDRDELVRLLDAGASSSLRDHVMACLLVLNGLRVSEAIGADVEDLGDARGHRTLAITRKRGKRQTIALAPRTTAALDALLDGRISGPILATSSGAHVDRHAASTVVRRLAREAGISKRVTPHTLRHGFVTAALDAGVALRDVQDAAGHADPRTTRRYDRGRQSLDRHATYSVATYLAG